MLKELFGCKSVAKILLYLFVNEKGYAYQLHRMLHIPLTPIQKSLARLEKGKILRSCKEGKTRMYAFNSDYLLSQELEMLLKKAFYHLPAEEKKTYYYLNPVRTGDRKQGDQLLESIWHQLLQVDHVTLAAKSSSKQTGRWNRKGVGKVTVKQENQAIIFQEHGTWKEHEQQGYQYSNSFRWNWNRLDRMISLEHLRFGESRPVLLFHLIPTEANLLESLNAYACGEDSYFGWLQYKDFFLRLYIRTIGPKKNEEIEYIYA